MIAAAVVAAMLMTAPAWAAATVFVSDVSPDGGATGVAADGNVTAQFGKAMKAGTIKGSTFFLKKQGSTTTIPAQLSYSATTNTATLNPNSNLAAGATYKATIKGGSTGVKALNGDRLAGTTDSTATFANNKVTWSFTVANAPPPPPVDQCPDNPDRTEPPCEVVTPPPVPPVTMSPNPLQLDNTGLCFGTTALLTVTNTSSGNVTFASVEIAGEDARWFSDGATGAVPFTVGAGNWFQDEVGFIGSERGKTYHATLTFKDGTGATIGAPVELVGTTSCIVVG